MALRRRHAGTIDSGAEARGYNAIEPCQEIRHLSAVHTAAFFLVEENHSAKREAFASRCRSRGLCIVYAQRTSIRFRLQFAFETAIEEHEKAETLPRNCSSMADP